MQECLVSSVINLTAWSSSVMNCTNNNGNNSKGFHLVSNLYNYNKIIRQ